MWKEWRKNRSRKKVIEGDKEEKSVNRGRLILDATCAPADIRYPTDLGLLNQVREHTEKVIDILYSSVEDENKKKDVYEFLEDDDDFEEFEID